MVADRLDSAGRKFASYTLFSSERLQLEVGNEIGWRSNA